MAVSFSNTHLRIPDGFSELLMGLTKEVLRDQPEDIPTYAAEYFEGLLKERQNCNLGPAEWNKRLKNRFYSSQAEAEASPEKQSAGGISNSKQESNKSRTESDSSDAEEEEEAGLSEEDDLSGDTEDEKHEAVEKHYVSIEEGLHNEESNSSQTTEDVQSYELSRSEDKQATISIQGKLDEVEKHGTASDQDEPLSTSADMLSFSSDLGIAENGGGDKQERENVDVKVLEENTQVDEPVADVDICATELEGTERIEKSTSEIDLHASEEENVKARTVQTLEGRQREEDHQAGNTEEEDEKETKACVTETPESVAHSGDTSDTNVVAKEEDSLVEVSFEDVPDPQHTNKVGEKQPEEEGSDEVLQTEIADVQEEEVTAAATTDSVSAIEHKDEPDTQRVEADLNSAREKTVSQLEGVEMVNENVVTEDTNLNVSDDGGGDEKAEGVGSIVSSHQPTTETDQADHSNKDDKTMGEDQQNNDTQAEDVDLEEGETMDTLGDLDVQGYFKMKDEDGDGGGAETHPSEITQSNRQTAPVEENSEISSQSHSSAQDLSEEHPRTGLGSESGDTLLETEVSNEDDSVAEEGKKIYSKAEEKDKLCEEENAGLSRTEDNTTADVQAEEQAPGVEQDSAQHEKDDSMDKQEECSRPQEEEDIMDIPLDDPEANRAAAKIQAGFRGHMTRKKMKPEDKAEGEEVSSTGDVLNGSQGDTATGGTGAVESDDTSVPEQ